MSKRLLYIFLVLGFFLASCNPEAPWSTKDVTIKMDVQNVSAGFVECNFSTNKEAYYLVAIEEARVGYDPTDPKNQKQFMTLALDNANVKYLEWRNRLLKNGEFNIAPFASHALQYGDVQYIFTGLKPNTPYWLYAFVVNPDKMEPTGHLYLQPIYTAAGSTMDIKFEYRVKGYWDYAYPLDVYGNICSKYPYVAATRDSLEIAAETSDMKQYFQQWYDELLAHPDQANILYGVKAVENDGFGSYLFFEEGHTYYTCFSGFDGPSDNLVIYKFHWTGNDFECYFTPEDAE